jgi:hypothetical protein
MKTVSKETASGIDFFRVNNDINGNGRYVVHFLAIPINESVPVLNRYDEALKKARTIGGRKYTARWFGGGIVFQSCSLQELANAINEL